MLVLAVSVTLVLTGTELALVVKLVRHTLLLAQVPPGVGVRVAVAAGAGVLVAVAARTGVLVAVAAGTGVLVAVAAGAGVLVAAGGGVLVAVAPPGDQSDARLARLVEPQPVASSQPVPAG